jgi:hypothetical protein
MADFIYQTRKVRKASSGKIVFGEITVNFGPDTNRNCGSLATNASGYRGL